jgi:hypothetical protein
VEVCWVLRLRAFQEVAGKLLLLSSQTFCVWIAMPRRRRWYPGRQGSLQGIVLLLWRAMVDVDVSVSIAFIALFADFFGFSKLFVMIVGSMYEAACIQRLPRRTRLARLL